MAIKIVSAIILFTFLSISSPYASEWYTFGKDSRHTGSTSVDFESPDLKNIWKFEPSQRIWNYEKTSYQKGMNVWSTSYATLEVDSKKIIYAGFYDHNLYAIDAENGESIWRYTTGGTLDSSPCAKYINGKPMVFIASGDRILYAINAEDGEKLWGYETETWDYTTSRAVPSSPIIEEIDGKDILFICFWNNNFNPFKNIQKGELFSFNAASGELLWRVQLTGLPLNTPAFTYVDNRPVIFVTSQDGNLYSIDARTGQKIWAFISDSPIFSSPTIIKVSNKEYIVFGTRFGNIYAIDPGSKAIFWKFKTGYAVDSTCAFSYIEDVSFIFAGSHDRNIYAIDALTGKKIWSFETGNFITSSPAVGNINGKKTVFISSLDNSLYALDATSGEVLWKYKTGKLIWKYATRGDTLWSSPILLNSAKRAILIFGSHDGIIYAFN